MTTMTSARRLADLLRHRAPEDPLTAAIPRQATGVFAEDLRSPEHWYPRYDEPIYSQLIADLISGTPISS